MTMARSGAGGSPSGEDEPPKDPAAAGDANAEAEAELELEGTPTPDAPSPATATAEASAKSDGDPPPPPEPKRRRLGDGSSSDGDADAAADATAPDPVEVAGGGDDGKSEGAGEKLVGKAADGGLPDGGHPVVDAAKADESGDGGGGGEDETGKEKAAAGDDPAKDDAAATAKPPPPGKEEKKGDASGLPPRKEGAENGGGRRCGDGSGGNGNGKKKKKKSKRIKAKNLDPALLALRRSIQRCCAADDLRGAIGRYRRAVEEGTTIEAGTYYNLLNLCDGLSGNASRVHVGTPRRTDNGTAGGTGGSGGGDDEERGVEKGGGGGSEEKKNDGDGDAAAAAAGNKDDASKEHVKGGESAVAGGGAGDEGEGDAVTLAERRSFAFDVQSRMRDAGLPLSETAYTALMKLLTKSALAAAAAEKAPSLSAKAELSAGGEETKETAQAQEEEEEGASADDYLSRAETLLTEAEATQQCRPKLRLYSPLLLAYCSLSTPRSLVSAFRIWVRMTHAPRVAKEATLGTAAGEGAGIRPSELEWRELMRCASSAGDAPAFKRCLEELAEDVAVPGKETTVVIRGWFESEHAVSKGADREEGGDGTKSALEVVDLPPTSAASLGPVVCPPSHSWEISPSTPVSSDGSGVLLSGVFSGLKLRPLRLPPRSWRDLLDMNESLVLKGGVDGHDSAFAGGRKGKKRKFFGNNNREEDKKRAERFEERKRRKWEGFKRYLNHRCGPPAWEESVPGAGEEEKKKKGEEECAGEEKKEDDEGNVAIGAEGRNGDGEKMSVEEDTKEKSIVGVENACGGNVDDDAKMDVDKEEKKEEEEGEKPTGDVNELNAENGGKGAAKGGDTEGGGKNGNEMDVDESKAEESYGKSVEKDAAKGTPSSGQGDAPQQPDNGGTSSSAPFTNDPRHGRPPARPYDAVIDGANVGYYDRNFAGAPPHVSYVQIDAVLRRLQLDLGGSGGGGGGGGLNNSNSASSSSSSNVLLVLHERHFRPDLLPRSALPIVRRWEDEGVLYKSPGGGNDDWYWLHAALWSGEGCTVVTNDEMRDHHFQMLAERVFGRWRERHRVLFDFEGGRTDNRDRRDGRRNVVLTYPEKYSRRIQRLDGDTDGDGDGGGGLVVPLPKRGDTNRFADGAHDADDLPEGDVPAEETYVCFRAVEKKR